MKIYHSKHNFLLSTFLILVSLTTHNVLFSAVSPDQSKIDEAILEKDEQQLKWVHTHNMRVIADALEQLIDPKKQYAKKRFYHWMDTYNLDDHQMLRAKGFKRLLNIAGNTTKLLKAAHDDKDATLNSHLLHQVMLKLGNKKDEETAHEQFLKDCVRSLVDNKADVNFEPRGGFRQCPSLELAYEYQRPDIAQTLLEAKADPTLHDKFSAYEAGTDTRYNNFIKDLQSQIATAATVQATSSITSDSLDTKPTKESIEKKVTST